MSATSSRLGLLVCVGTIFLAPLVASATVYSWTRADGALVLSNDLGEVPEDRKKTVSTFTSKLAGRAGAGDAPPSFPPRAATIDSDAYERGFARGVRTATRRVPRARTIRSVQVILQPSAPIVCYPAPAYAFPFYGAVGPFVPFFPYGWGYAYGFRHGRLVAHSHFFPGVRGRSRGLFFPYGHFSHQGFLFGHGFVLP